MRRQMHCVFLDRQPPPHAFLTQQPEGVFVVDAAIAHQMDDGAGDKPPATMPALEKLHPLRVS